MANVKYGSEKINIFSELSGSGDSWDIDTIKSLQDKVNEWLNENKNVQIVDRHFTVTLGNDGRYYTVAIFYREPLIHKRRRTAMK